MDESRGASVVDSLFAGAQAIAALVAFRVLPI
jgi:hypothetical protein